MSAFLLRTIEFYGFVRTKQNPHESEHDATVD